MMRGMTENSRSNAIRSLGTVAVSAIAAVLALTAAPAGAQDIDDPADLGIGMEIFNAGCTSCHLVDGTGSAAGRSLIDVALEQPDRSVHIASVTNGRGNMPSYEGRLTEDEIDAAVTYVRLTFLSEEDPMEELPRTGLSEWIFAAGFGLVGAGVAAVLAVEPGVAEYPSGFRVGDVRPIGTA